jgi:hypothetical protein
MKINSRNKNLKSVLLVFFVLFIVSSFNNFSKAQSTNSPYSRYGIGDINNKINGQSFALGGSTIALQNDTTAMFFINSSNPASYAGMRLTTAEIGVNYNRIRLLSADTKKNLNNASFGYISFAFPFKKWWGGCLGLVPYSSVGYSIADEKTFDKIGTVNYLYEGTGGISQVYFGNGIKPLYGLPGMFVQSKKYKALKAENNYAKIRKILNRKKSLASLALGVNASYLFGSIENARSSSFNNANSFNTRTTNTTRVGDIYLDYGIQYSHLIDSVKGRDLKENVKIIFGANFAAQTDVNAKIDSLSVNYYTNGTGYEYIKDTVEYVDGHKGTITFPLSFGVGLGFKKGDRWLVTGDFAMQNWSNFQAFNQNLGFKNSMRISAGAQYVPNSKAGLKQYFRRVNYRIGGHYSQTALELKNSQLTETALSIGLGFPVGRNYLLQSFSMINIGVEIGQRGTITNGLIKEQFVKTTIGFTINDRWFVKPKVD